MRSQPRRYLLFLLLLLLSVGWVFLMSLDVADNFQAPAADGVQATITWLDWQWTGFPRVEAHISVLDAAGQPVRGLASDAFALREDDFNVPIQEFLGSGEQSVTTMLVIDRSGSMDGDKIIGARAAANTFVDQMRPERDRAGLIVFDDSVDSLQPLANPVDALRRSINGIAVDGGTAFYDAVYQGLQGLQGENGRRIILALTDGLDNSSSRTPQEIIQLAQNKGIAIYTVGLGQEARDIFRTGWRNAAADCYRDGW
ncbi:MAG: VWA domain-containing protein [Chloroflexi bacterium]|nr:VWA domain-containing protein [Chloroflexota bacterium]